MSLRRLLRTHLAPYRKTLWIVVALQAIQTSATLALPALNSNLINEGVVTDRVCGGGSVVRHASRNRFWSRRPA